MKKIFRAYNIRLEPLKIGRSFDTNQRSWNLVRRGAVQQFYGMFSTWIWIQTRGKLDPVYFWLKSRFLSASESSVYYDQIGAILRSLFF